MSEQTRRRAPADQQSQLRLADCQDKRGPISELIEPDTNDALCIAS